MSLFGPSMPIHIYTWLCCSEVSQLSQLFNSNRCLHILAIFAETQVYLLLEVQLEVQLLRSYKIDHTRPVHNLKTPPLQLDLASWFVFSNRNIQHHRESNNNSSNMQQEVMMRS